MFTLDNVDILKKKTKFLKVIRGYRRPNIAELTEIAEKQYRKKFLRFFILIPVVQMND